MDLFDRCRQLAASSDTVLHDLTSPTGWSPAKDSIARYDERFSDAGWPSWAGGGPLATTGALVSLARSVLGDTGHLLGDGLAAVTIMPLTRYVIEHVADVRWILHPGTYDGTDVDAANDPAAAEQGRRDRVARNALRRFLWTQDFEKGRTTPPVVDSAALKAELIPAGLTRETSRKPWTLAGQLVPSMTSRVEDLIVPLAEQSSSNRPKLYSLLSMSTHPNPYALAEVNSGQKIERPATEVARLFHLAASSLSLGFWLLAKYAEWDVAPLRDWDADVAALLTAATGESD